MGNSSVISTVFCLILIWSSASAQLTTANFSAPALDQNVLTLDFSVVTPFDDFLLSVSAEASKRSQDLSYCGFFTARPFAKKFRIQTSDNFYYQFRENRFIIGGLIRKSYRLGNLLKWSLSGGGGFSFADYKGTSRKPPREWIPIMGLSLLSPFDDAHIRIGYKYMQLPGSGSHHLEVGFSFGD